MNISRWMMPTLASAAVFTVWFLVARYFVSDGIWVCDGMAAIAALATFYAISVYAVRSSLGAFGGFVVVVLVLVAPATAIAMHRERPPAPPVTALALPLTEEQQEKVRKRFEVDPESNGWTLGREISFECQFDRAAAQPVQFAGNFGFAQHLYVRVVSGKLFPALPLSFCDHPELHCWPLERAIAAPQGHIATDGTSTVSFLKREHGPVSLWDPNRYVTLRIWGTAPPHSALITSARWVEPGQTVVWGSIPSSVDIDTSSRLLQRKLEVIVLADQNRFHDLRLLRSHKPMISVAFADQNKQWVMVDHKQPLRIDNSRNGVLMIKIPHELGRSYVIVNCIAW